MAAKLNIDCIINLADGLLRSLGIEKSKQALLDAADLWLNQTHDRPILYHPYISEAGERGPFVDVAARSSFVGLGLGHGFGDMVGAVFDGLALSARDCYAAMGQVPQRVRLTGGAARSAALRGVLGGALNAAVETSEREEAGAAGAAMIAAVSLGIYDNMESCAAEWVSPYIRAAEMPNLEIVRRFDALFPIYQQTRQALRPVWHAMAGKSLEHLNS